MDLFEVEGSRGSESWPLASGDRGRRSAEDKYPKSIVTYYSIVKVLTRYFDLMHRPLVGLAHPPSQTQTFELNPLQ